MPVTLKDIQAARERLSGVLPVTPCPESIPLSEITGARIFCKLDNQQRTGSFKEREARNALELLDEEKRKRAASAGNHALGLAYRGSLLGIPVTVVMPQFAPLRHPPEEEYGGHRIVGSIIVPVIQELGSIERCG
jgi:threonine dehydratase